MNPIKIIKTKKDYKITLDRIEEIFDSKKGTLEGDELELLLLVVKDYEDKHFQIPFPNPIDAIKLKMQEKGIHNKDLVPMLGSKGYVSLLLNGKKPLTVSAIIELHKLLGIPTNLLLGL
jgi:HTH-type transcriptional regulator/antitoxin HigA